MQMISHPDTGNDSRMALFFENNREFAAKTVTHYGKK